MAMAASWGTAGVASPLMLRRASASAPPSASTTCSKQVRDYRANVAVVMIFQAALIGMETIMPLYIQGVLGHSATVSGLTLLPGALIGAFTGMIAGRLFDRYGVRRPVTIGCVLIVVAALGFAFALNVASLVPVVAAVYTVMFLGMQFTMTPLNTWGVNALPNDAIQHAQSTSNTLNQVAGSFGTALLASISNLVSSAQTGLAEPARTFAGYHATFSVTAMLTIAAVIVIMIFVRDRAKSPGDSPCADGATAPRAEAHGIAEIPGSAIDGTARVRDAMNRNAVTVGIGETMDEVILVMDRHETTGVTVVDENGVLAGFVTDGDVARYLARQDGRISSPSTNIFALIRDDDDFAHRLEELAYTPVMRIATKHVVSVDADLPLDEACAIFASRRLKKMPVTSNGRLVGALSRRNVVHYLISNGLAARS